MNPTIITPEPHFTPHAMSHSSTNIHTLTSLSTNVFSQPPPELPDEGTKTKIAFIENGEVIEQRGNFNNISGEAILSVPPHGNMSELTVVLQPSTVGNFL